MAVITFLFIILELIFYLSFMSIDMFYQNFYFIGILLKFSSILLCFLFSMVTTLWQRKKDNTLAIALFFVVISDFFLLLEEKYMWGMLSFCVVQLILSYYLLPKEVNYPDLNQVITCKFRYGKSLKTFIQSSLFYAVISALIIGFMDRIGIKIEALIVIAVFYFITFLFNLKQAYLHVKYNKSKKTISFAIGLSLYMLCDINVAIFNMSSYLSMEGKLFHIMYQISTIAMWAFYLPGIVLISYTSSKKEQ